MAFGFGRVFIARQLKHKRNWARF